MSGARTPRTRADGPQAVHQSPRSRADLLAELRRRSSRPADRAPDVVGVDVAPERARLLPRREQPAIAATICARVSAKMSDPPAATDCSAPFMPFLAVDVGDEARPSSPPAPRPAGARRAARRRPREVLDLGAVGGLDERVAGREVAVERADPDAGAAWPRRPARRRCPRAANSSPAAASSFSRLRRASARCGRSGHGCKRRMPPVGATLVEPEDSSASILGGTQQMSKVWFITGTSKGFGRVWAEAALERGDRVAATARNADTLTPLVEAYGDNVLAAPARRHRQGRDRRRRQAGARALRPPRRRRQQRRLRPVRRRSRRSREEQARDADRDQPVRPAVGHAGRAADHARAGRGPHHPGLVDRRRERVPDPRALPRVEVGPRGLQPVARGRGRRVRHQGHDRRARRLLDRLARPVGGRRPTRWPSTTRRATTARGVHRRRWPSRGDPQATGPAILELVDADEPPLRAFFGTGTLDMIRAEYEQRIENWERWDHLAVAAQGGVTTS